MSTLKEIRNERGFKQHEAATLLKITSDYLSMLENGKRRPGNKLILRMADVYKKKPEEIFLAAHRTICASKK